MRHAGIWAAVLGLSLASPSFADSPAAVSVPTIEKLIAQLGDSNFKVRESATRALAERAEESLPLLRKAQPHPDAEVRARIAKLITDAERSTLMAPRRVTLKLDQVPIKEAVAALAKESGYRIELQGQAQQVVSVDCENVTFWEAFDRLSLAGGLVLQQHHDGSGAMIVNAQNSFSPYVDHRGPFRLSAISFNYNKSLSFGSVTRNQLSPGSRTEQLNLMFNIVSEPRLPLLGLGTPKLIHAIDENDVSLMPPALGRAHETSYSGYYGYRNTMLQTQVQLSGNGSSRGLKSIRGTVPVTILAEQKPEIVIEKILEVKKKKFEGKDVTIEIDEVKTGQGSPYQVVMTARRSGKDVNGYDYTWTNSLHQRIELTDEKGNKFTSQGFNWNNGTPSSVTGTFMFGNGNNAAIGKPHKLTYYDWLTTQHAIEFEFKGLPLP